MSASFLHVADVLRQFGRLGPGFALCIAFGSCGWHDTGPSAADFPIRRSYESDGVQLQLSLDRESLTTAESVILRLEIECAEDDEVEFPVAEDGIGEFAVLEEATLPDRLRDGGRVVRGREYVMQPFLPGEYEVPALAVTLNESSQVSTEPVKLAVQSVLDDPETAELRDIAEPVDIPVPWWWWVVFGLALAAALTGMAWWWKRRKTARSAPRHVSPHEAALAALEALLGEDLVSRGAFKLFYLRLSDIVRHYVEERFGLRAPEQTTEEFLAAMSAAPVIRRDHQTLLRGFLNQADLVKFAKFVPDANDVEGAVKAARRFIRQTVPDEPLAGVQSQRQGMSGPAGAS